MNDYKLFHEDPTAYAKALDAGAAREHKQELRDKFAGLAMQELMGRILANPGYVQRFLDHDECAERAYEYADAMLKQRSKKRAVA